MTAFVGRKRELSDLKLLQTKKVASFVVIRGRRRVGKSRLIEEFGKSAKFYEFSGLPPAKGTTAQKQREEFLRQFRAQSNIGTINASDWGDIFALLAKETSKGPQIILLDEISWMGSRDPTFLGKLKIAWDLYFKKNPRLTLVVCGSVSSWIEKNILSHTGFVGRISLSMQLEELPIRDSYRLLKQIGCNFPTAELFKLLGVTGGVPRYLEEMQKDLTVDENIKRSCFRKDGLLFREFDQLFSDLFLASKASYKKIISLFEGGELEAKEVAEKMGFKAGGYTSKALEDLVNAGFLRKSYSWNLHEKKEKLRPRFRLSDNYTRFFLRYVEPNRLKIESGHFKELALSSLPGFNSLMGFQFKNLVLQNREFLFKELHLRREEILFDSSYIQRATKQKEGCQIDLMIQTHSRLIYLCEIKFSKDPITPIVIEEVERKVKALKLPRGFACNPVLIHLGGVTDRVVEKNYFTKIIDFSTILEDI